MGESGQYFFLSYPHTPKFVDLDESDPDFWAAKFFKDLCDHLFQIGNLPLGADHPSIGAVRGWRLHNRDLEVQPT